MVIAAGAEPAVIHHEALDPDPRGFLGQRYLALLVHRELGGFPTIVEDGPKFRCGQDFGHFEAMHQSRGTAHSLTGIAAIKDWRLQSLARLQTIREIEGIE